MHTDAPLLLLTGARDGSVHLHEAVLWRHGAVIAGGGRRGGTGAAAGPGPAVWGLDGYGIELRLSRRLQGGGGSAEVLSGLLNHYHQRQQLGWVAATGDAGGRLRFHAPNGTLVKVGGRALSGLVDGGGWDSFLRRCQALVHVMNETVTPTNPPNRTHHQL